MLRRFVQNTVISAVAYALAGVLGLFAVGLIARSYGLAVLGLIVLVRAFLPTGFLALFDFGVSETTTQAVARGRVGDWRAASEKVSLLTVIAAAVGFASGVALWSAAGSLAAIFKVAPDQAAAFISILDVTALVLPIAFLGLVAEGTLKGFEQYGWLRLTEVGGNVLYVTAVYALVWRGAPFEWIAYSYLAVMAAKYIVLAGVVARAASATSLRFCSWTAIHRRDVLHRCWLMLNNRIAGILQQPLVPLAIGALYGPAEVGTYDLITRLPRFLKTTMAPLHSAILPISTHIDEATDTRRLQMLGRNGLVLPGAILVPVLVVTALFSAEILKVWVGPQHSDQWPWLALSMLIPAITVMLGAGQTALMVRSDFLRFNTRLLYLQVGLQYLVTGLSLLWLRERAFILGWVVSYVVFAPVIAHHMLSQMKLPSSLFWEQLGRQVLVGAILAGLVVVSKMFFDPGSLIALGIVGGLSCIIAWLLSGAIVLSGSDRAMFGRFARAMTPRS
ncbi:lipopolysaccharide biosynthesis protein [Bradyrhizobium sp. AUGA SZCCT0283]|uniref:lipopolysaccharide biosynthesis protein n=1 Tax=Bradyrhizobium sp. AUGA SZCCT0283 TaxID=2807671 RepID=UPI001BAE2E01|nr:teichoic acid transporter [Bradyrhizobium sp. AUGA SZCCT0283]MBR1277661.1 teichoic acid transporter [Bradyrhizobium sp. AUGA SZCCT0283]